jgi:hypothetical protein
MPGPVRRALAGRGAAAKLRRLRAARGASPGPCLSPPAPPEGPIQTLSMAELVAFGDGSLSCSTGLVSSQHLGGVAAAC